MGSPLRSAPVFLADGRRRQAVGTAFRLSPLKPVGDPDHGFGAAEEEHAVRCHLPRNSFQHLPLCFWGKIEQDIAAKYDIEQTQRLEILHKVPEPKFNHLT